MNYTRNAQAVHSQLVENKAGQVICLSKCKIQVPTRFQEAGLCTVGTKTSIYGLFPVILENGQYSVCNVNSMVDIEPSTTTIVKINDIEHYEFGFEANSVVIKNTTLICLNTMMYNVFNEFVFMGKVPWYVEYDDLGKLFDTAKHHADSNVGQALEVIEFIAAMVTRPKKDRSVYLRTVAQSYNDTKIENIDFVPLNSIYYSVNSTLNKITGSYFGPGVVSALVKPTENVEKIESILRA